MPSETIFATTIQKTNSLLSDIGRGIGMESDKKHSYALLRSVVHALRDRLPLEESVELGAQLPMLVRGFYYEGWKPSQVPKKFNKEEFLFEIQKEFNFKLEISLEEAVHIVMRAMRSRIDSAEMDKISNVLPKKFEEFFI